MRDRTAIAPITTREELVYLLSRACELEHNLSCVYLFAAYSLKSSPAEGGLTEGEAAMVRRWKQRLAAISIEEMLHLAQACNILTAVGGAPHFARTNFPLPAVAFPLGIKLSLEPFSLETIERFICYEMPEEGVLGAAEEARVAALRGRFAEAAPAPVATMMTGFEPFDIDFATTGDLYHKIGTAFDHIAEAELFIGPPEAQAKAKYVDFDNKLIAVLDSASAHAAIEMIIEQGEAPTKAHPDAHFNVFEGIRAEYLAALARAAAEGRVFDPVRRVASNPMTRFYDDAAIGTLIADPLTHDIADLFNVAYDTMLLMLSRFFAHPDESEKELEQLARATLRLMASVLRPLGEALTRLPVGPAAAGMTAGPGFGYNRDIHLLPHKRSAWVFFAERLHQLAARATRLGASETALPREIEEAAAVLEALSEEFAPADRAWNAAAQGAEFRGLEGGRQCRIAPLANGPLLVTNLETLIGAGGAPLPTNPEIALCRCGGSARKPFCDGSHARLGFTGAREDSRSPDGVARYRGDGITVLFNRLQCSASENCWRSLPQVFREGELPWIQPDRAAADAIVAAIERCPSGALRYVRDGREGPTARRPSRISVAPNGPYLVEGGIALETDAWCEGASREHFTLCRCGGSRNKPFCDGSHWRIGFIDPET